MVKASNMRWYDHVLRREKEKVLFKLNSNCWSQRKETTETKL